jgi:hypothetical protein
VGDFDHEELRVGAADDVAEAEAERTAHIVVERLTTTPAATSTTSLGEASGWTSAATRSLFRTAGESSGRVRRSSQPTVVSSDAVASTPNGMGRIQRAASAVPGSASGPDGGVLDDATAGRIKRSRGGGAPLDGAVRPHIESAFGADFGSVRVHADSPLPAEVGAVAFTLGNDVHFGPGQYRPDTPGGLHTLSHELAHVVQQGSASGAGIHRLMSAKDFKKSAKEKVYQVHGKTMTDIDTQLEAYDKLKENGGLYDIGSEGIDKGITILSNIRGDIEFWMKSHVQDTKREQQRAALDSLLWEVRIELTELRNIRKDYVTSGLTGELKVEPNKFVTKMEGSASSVFEMLSPIVAAAIPSPGDGAQLEISVKIPVDPSTAGYVGFSLGIGLQRQDRTTTKISLNAAVNGGLQVMGVADVGLELGAFIEAQGKDPKAALQLISWGWYRRFRESVLPREVASFMWGGSTGAVGWARSETWAANVENANFKTGLSDDGQDLSSGVGSGSTTNAYVRTGAYGSAAASGKLGPGGIASLEGSASLTGGTHYDKDTISARKEKRGGELGKAEKMPTRGKTEYLGTRFMKFEAGLSAGVGPFSGSLGGALEWMWDQGKYGKDDPAVKKDPKKLGQKKGVRLEYLSAGFSAGATVPLGGKLADQLSDGIVKLAPVAINLVKMLTNKASNEDKTGTPEGLGHVVAQGEAMATAFGAFPQDAFSFTDFSVSDEPTKTLAEQLKSGADVGESASTISINIAVGVNLWDGSNAPSIDITLNSEQGIQLDASIVSVKAVRSRRIVRLKIGRDKKKWTAAVD